MNSFSIVNEYDKNISFLDKRSLQNCVMNWVLKMQTGPTQFRMNEGVESTIFASCFALFIFDLFGEVKEWSQKEKNLWVDFINTFQDKNSGYFLPGFSRYGHNTKPVHQLTCFCLSVLSMLNARPKYELKFLNQWKTKDDIHNYLKKKGCLHGLPGSGNMAMFLSIFLTYQYEKEKEPYLLDLIDAWFYWHNKTQHASTGFWGNSLKSKYYGGFQNAFHQFEIYNYWKKPIQYNERIVDTVLKLQDSDGFFAPTPGGGGCWDYDATAILINCGVKKGYKNLGVERSLLTLLKAVLKNQNEDGGFCESTKKLASGKDILKKINLSFIFNGRIPYLYYYRLRKTIGASRKKRDVIFTQWAKEGRHWTQTDMWNTWFKCLTIAEIDTTLSVNQKLNKKGWNFQKMIGLGYFQDK